MRANRKSLERQAQSAKPLPSGESKDTMPNEAVLPDNRIQFPGVRIAESSEMPKITKRRLAWYLRLGIRIGTLMAQPANPKGWGWNPSVITLCIVIGGILFTAGMYIQHERDAVETLQREHEATQRMAESSKRESSYAVAKVDGGDGHAVVTATATPAQKGK